MTNDIIFEVTNHLAKITLNREKALNAMSYDMFVALHAHLEKWAADDFRSTNGQLEWIISKALKDAGRQKQNNT